MKAAHPAWGEESVCFFVLCNRHWFNKAPGPDPRGTEMGVTYLPFALADAGYAEWNKINIHNESDFGFFSIRPFTPYS